MSAGGLISTSIGEGDGGIRGSEQDTSKSSKAKTKCRQNRSALFKIAPNLIILTPDKLSQLLRKKKILD
jgi:hypothetical protein